MTARTLTALLCLLLVAACGTRLDTKTVGSAQSNDLSLEQPSQGELVAAPAPEQGGAPGAVGAAQGLAPARNAPRGASKAQPGPRAAASVGNGGATDVGVTATEIRVGNVSALTGPLPGLFRPMAEAVQAYFRVVNERGGVNGRRFVLIGCDDELNGEKRGACLRSLAADKKVFAFVGNLSAADENDASYLDGELKGAVPDVGGFALSYSRSHSSGYWSQMGALRRELASTAQWEVIRSKTGFRKPMVFWHNIQISREQGQTLEHELATVLGVQNDPTCRPARPPPCVRNAETSPAQPDYSLQVGQAKADGVDSFFTSMEIASNIKLLRAIDNNRDASFNPTVHFELATYSQDFIDALGPRAKGVYIRIPHIPFSEPGFQPLAEYLVALKRYFPSSVPTSFGVFGWLGARFFVESVTKAGPNLTRARLVEVMKTFVGPRPFVADGLIGPNPNIRKEPFSCHVVTQVTDEGGKLDFRRASGPGFVCATNTFKWRKAFGE